MPKYKVIKKFKDPSEHDRGVGEDYHFTNQADIDEQIKAGNIEEVKEESQE